MKTKNAKIISGMLCQQDRAHHHSTQAVEMSVTVNNSPIQVYLIIMLNLLTNFKQQW